MDGDLMDLAHGVVIEDTSVGIDPVTTLLLLMEVPSVQEVTQRVCPATLTLVIVSSCNTHTCYRKFLQH